MSPQQPPTPPPRKRRLRPVVAAAASALALAASAALLPTMTSNAAVPPPPAGWTTVFSDDFSGPSGSLPSGANWRFSLGHGYPGGPPNWGTGEIAAHTNNPANVSLDGAGNLRITPRRDGGGGWTSARIETNKQDLKAPAGGVLRIEGRIQMPNVTGAAALGYWPAFWALGSPYRGNWWNWPGVGEFDIMENVNGVNRVWGVLHCGTSPGGTCNEKNGIANSRPCPGASCQGAFHAYRFEWDRSISPNQLRWYVDGQLFHTVSQAQIEAGAWNQMTGHGGYFIILNVAIGGEFPDNYSGTRTPGPGIVPGHPMVVDYVAAWTRTGGGGPDPTTPPTPTPPSCGPNLAQGRPTTASSQESAALGPQFAVDGNPGTRWSSTHSDNQWIQVDLGSARALSKARLNWEAAYSTSYQILTSTNGSTWTQAHSTSGGAGGVEDIGIATTARYVRMNGQTRGTPYGHSLWEFEIYGPCTTPTPGPTATTTPGPNPTTPGPTQPPGETTWAPNTYYAVGALVTYSGVRYRCRQAHTSITTWEPPNTPALWEPL
jgi:beta-glucanase (GH16 family)